MRLTTIALALSTLMLTGCASNQAHAPAPPAEQQVTVGCAMCIYNMDGVEDCVLAVKVAGTPYLVTGSDIDDHGDAHAADGLCNAEREAVAVGRIEDGKYVAQRIKLRPVD